jgi:hypothetical protein
MMPEARVWKRVCRMTVTGGKKTGFIIERRLKSSQVKRNTKIQRFFPMKFMASSF